MQEKTKNAGYGKMPYTAPEIRVSTIEQNDSIIARSVTLRTAGTYQYDDWVSGTETCSDTDNNDIDLSY
ncbi:MAG: hypothetical protein LBS52_02430 [Dysgonamonadaceae bacterium]|jgi:hypothetical protein|nr:hypothetical protein [Dysgonamonadaceae bacterium]